MKKSFTLILLALLCVCGFAQTIDPVLKQEMRQRSDDEKIKVIVVMKQQYDRQQLNRRAAHYVTRADRREFVVNELKQFAEASQYDLRRTLDEMERNDMTTAPKIIWMANAMYFSATKQAINDLAMRRDVGLIGLDEEKHVLFDEESTPASNTREITSNVTQVNADQVWDLGFTGQGVVVAVIDTGVNYNHLDLADHLWDGGDAYPNHGYDFYNNDNDPMDDNSHGTHCAGTVCGDGTAGSQTGMAPDATLMCVKVLSSGGNGAASTTCYAMQWAVEQGCDLFSMSLGWANSTITERTLFRNTCAAILDAGVVGAIAAGNEGDALGSFPIPDNVRAPGSCPPPYMDPIQANNIGGLSCTVCVGAVDVNDNAAYFTSHGPVTWTNTEFGDYPYTAGSTTDFGLIRPDVCAPGVSIKSAYYGSNNGYTTKSGTSMATPCTAGCISLLLSKNINATPEEICQVLEETAVPLDDGKSNIYGYGRIDVLAAINALYSGPLTLDSYTVNDSQGNNDGKLNAGESVTLSLTLTNESDLALNGATMTLTSESEYVTITDGSESLPSFNVGQTRTIENMFAFTLSNDAPAKRNIQFTGEIFAGGESLGTVRISVMVYGHILHFVEVTVLNDNNGNSSLEAGETADLHVVISNVGNDVAESVVGTLSTIYPYLTINDNNKSFGSLEVNEQASADFNVTLSAGAPDSYTIDFSLDLVDAAQRHTDVDFELWRKAITLTSNPAGAGTLSGAGYYGQGQTCTIFAEANAGYAFKYWTLDGAVVSYLPGYTFEVTGEAEYVANFQTVTNGVVIGDGAGTEDHLPSYSFYCYTLSQQIYTANELNLSACEISSVSFFNAGYAKTRTYDIYMVNTDKSSFDSSSDWITASEENLVFSGSVSMTNGNWTTIYFNTPFAYDGSSNVALIVDDNTGSWNSYNMSCRVSSTENCQAIYVYNDYTDYDPISPTSYYGTQVTVKNQVIFGIASYDYTVTVSASPQVGGTVSGGGSCYLGQPITVSATANEGYCFYYWMENGSIVSYEANYSFSVSGNRNLVAVFGLPLNITVSANPVEGGTVSGAGTFDYGASTTITASANDGYVFLRWTLNGSPVSYLSTYTFSVTSAGEYVAEFEWVSNGIAIGDANMAYDYLPSYSVFNYTLSQQIYTANEIGSACEITSISFFNTGSLRTRSYTIYMTHTDKYAFDSDTDWITVTEDDEVFTGSVTMVVNNWTTIVFDTPFLYDGTSNLALIIDDNTGSWNSSMYCRAFDTQDNQSIWVYSDYTNYDPFNPSEYYGNLVSMKNQVILGLPCTVTATANPVGSGSVTGAGNYGYGATCTLTATPNPGYIFLNWTEDGTPVSSEATYSFTVNGNRNLVANFVDEGEACSIVFDLYDSYGDGWNGNYLVIDYGNGNTEQITISSGSSASYSRVVATGSFITLNWISGNWISECSFDVRFENGVPIYHGANLSSDFEYGFTLDCEEAYAPHVISVIVEPEEGGSVEGAGTYNAGTTITLTATANEGYIFMNWTENGTILSLDPTYSFLVSSDRELVANFGTPIAITATASPEEGGTITGGGYYAQGHTCTLTATAKDKYVFVNWTNTSGSVVSWLSTYSFTVGNTGAEYVANFQRVSDGVVIGDALSTSYYLPSYTYYPYSLSEQIYTADEIGMECDISSVAFFNTSTSSQLRNLTVYLIQTDKTSFTGSYDWITATEENQVFSGNVTIKSRDWTIITFDVPFHYDGTSNLALVVDDNTGSYGSTLQFRTYTTSDYQSLYYNNSSTDYDPINPTGYGYRTTTKNQVIFGFPSFDYAVTVSSDPSYGGSVMGGGTFAYGQPCIVSATANEGYCFYNWTENDEVVSTDANYFFSVTASRNLVAHFGMPITINASANPVHGGTISGSGSYAPGHVCNLTATANSGYTFISWTKNGEVVSYLSSYTFVVEDDADYVANFEQVYNGVAIGDAFGTNSYLPSSSYYNYTLSQQIYTADEIGGANEISSIAFFNAGNTKTRNFTIYLKHTEKAAFNSNNDWIPVAYSDQVYYGSVTLAKGQWTYINFDVPFAYNGTSNLVLVVDDNTGDYSYGMYCRVFVAEDTQTLQVYGDELNYNPHNPSNYTGSLLSLKNQVIFGFTSSTVQQTITLTAGSNWFSTYVDITLDDLKAALVSEAPSNSTITIKSATQNTVFSRGRWNGSLDWDVAKMYIIIVPTDCQISLEGMLLNPAEHPITIAGNGSPTWIGFPFSNTMTVTDAFNGFAVNNDIIKSSNSNSQYSRGRWNGSVTNLEPGLGYIYVSAPGSADRVLIYQSSKK